MTTEEWKNLRLQIATSSLNYGGRRHLPHAFTEYGALMLANILRSKRAQAMSVEIIRAFIHLRKTLATHNYLEKEIKELKSFVLKRSHSTDQEFRRVWRAIEKLSATPAESRPIGFHLD